MKRIIFIAIIGITLLCAGCKHTEKEDKFDDGYVPWWANQK